LQDWLPKSFVAWRGYKRVTFLADLIAGITVGLVALPLAMAFAISSGMRPEAGIYTAIVAGAITSIFGGTRTQVSGPTGAFVVVVAGIVASHGVDGLFTVTLLAGLMLVILGATGLGTAVKYIPRPVVVGFTNGIAILIASTQLKDFFGLALAKTPGPFLERMIALWDVRSSFDLTTFAVSAGSLIALILMVRYVKRIPGAIVVLLGATVVVSLAHLHVETIGTRFGGIPQGLPKFQVPTLHLNLIPGLLGPAITVAMLGAIESLMSAVVAD
jgi:sulfate permease, SulP family